jgi:GAF domain-containing protein
MIDNQKLLACIDKLSQSSVESGNLEGTLQHITQTAHDLFAADVSVMFAINPITRRFLPCIAVAGELHAHDPATLERPRLDGVTHIVLTQSGLIVADLVEQPEYQSTFKQQEGIRAFAAVTLQTRQNKPLAVLYLNFRQPRTFATDEYHLLDMCARQSSLVLQHTRLLRRYREIARIGREINEELETTETLFKKLQQHIGGILDTNYGFVLAIYQPQTDSLDLYITEAGQQIVRPHEPLAGGSRWVIQERQPLIIPNLSQMHDTLPVQLVDVPGTNVHMESLIFIPLVLRDQPLGVLSIQHPQPYAYDEEDVIILQLLSNHIALALSNIHLYKSLRRLNETGQRVTQQFDSEQVLSDVAASIQQQTKADLVILYPYEQQQQRFVMPPHVSGTLLDSCSPQPQSLDSEDLAALVLRSSKPVYAKNSRTLYADLGGDLDKRKGNFEAREALRSTGVLPLKVGEETLGILFVNFRRPQRFDAPQKLLIDGLANYAAIAIKNSRTFTSWTQRRVQELEFLQQIDRAISRTLDLEEVFQTILQLARQHIPATDEASILLYNARTETLETRSAIGKNARSSRRQSIPIAGERGLTRWAFVQKTPVWVANVRTDPDWCNRYIEVNPNIHAELDVPLIDGNDVVGVLNFESVTPNAFSQADRDFLVTLAGQAVLAVKNAQAYEREKRLAQEQQTLVEISKEITRTLDLTQIIQTIIQKAAEHVQADTAAILLYESRRRTLKVEAAIGPHIALNQTVEFPVDASKGVTSWVFAHKYPVRIDNVLTDPAWRDLYVPVSPDICSEMDVPLMMSGDVIIGVLNVESRREAAFSQADEDFLVALAGQAVLAIKNAQTYEREKRIADERQALITVNQQIVSQLDPSRVFALILEKALEITDSRAGNLMLYDALHNDLWMAAEHGVEAHKKGRRQKLDEGIVGIVAQTHRPLLVADVTQPPWQDIYIPFIPTIHSELAVPLIEGDSLRGVLNIESPLVDHFDEHDERLLTALADLAVVAIQNARQYEHAETGRKRLRALHQIDQNIISQLDNPDQVMHVILENALVLTQAETADLHLYDQQTNTTTYFARLTDSPFQTERIDFSDEQTHVIQRGIVAHVAVTCQSYRTIGDAQTDPYYVGDPDAAIHSEVAVPLLDSDELIGVLNLESSQYYVFDDEDVEVLELFAGQAVIAIQNARAYARAERERQRFQSLYEVGQALGEISDLTQLDQAYKIVAQTAFTHSQSQVIIRRYDAPTQRLILAYATRADMEPPSSFNCDEGVNGQVFQKRHTITIHDLHNPPAHIEARPTDLHARTLVVTPIQFKDRYYGNLGLNHEQVAYFSEADIKLFEGLAQQLAITIYRLETVQAQQKAEQQAREVEVMSSIGQAAFELAHRLGNELGLVRSYVNDLRQELQIYNIPNTTVEEILKKIVRDVGNVLDLSKGLKRELADLREEEAERPQPAVVPVKIFVDDAISSYPTLPSNIYLHVAGAYTVSVHAVPKQVADILRNLFCNAVEAMPAGGTITFYVRHSGTYIDILVQDSGTGIPPERQTRVFDLFYSTKGGFGFGLWSARRYALANGGDLLLDSQPGSGTTFILRLPRAD